MIRSYKRLNDNMHNPKRRKGNDWSLLLALRYYLTFMYCAQVVLFLMFLIFTFFCTLKDKPNVLTLVANCICSWICAFRLCVIFLLSSISYLWQLNIVELDHPPKCLKDKRRNLDLGWKQTCAFYICLNQSLESQEWISGVRTFRREIFSLQAYCTC